MRGNQTPLVRAARAGSLAVIRQLFKREDVDLNRMYGDALPPPSWAIMMKRKKVVKFLLVKSEITFHLPHENGSPYELATRSESTTIRGC